MHPDYSWKTCFLSYCFCVISLYCRSQPPGSSKNFSPLAIPTIDLTRMEQQKIGKFTNVPLDFDAIHTRVYSEGTSQILLTTIPKMVSPLTFQNAETSQISITCIALPAVNILLLMRNRNSLSSAKTFAASEIYEKFSFNWLQKEVPIVAYIDNRTV